MKTKIGLGVLAIVVIVSMVELKKSSPKSLVEVAKNVMKKEPLKMKSKTVLEKNEVKAELNSIEEAADLLTLENELIEKSNEEIKRAIQENNEWAKNENFIARANANQLDEAATKKFTMYIRLNNVLHKILIDREIKEMERN